MLQFLMAILRKTLMALCKGLNEDTKADPVDINWWNLIKI